MGRPARSHGTGRGGGVVLAMQMQGCDSQTHILAFTLPLKLRQPLVQIISKSPEEPEKPLRALEVLGMNQNTCGYDLTRVSKWPVIVLRFYMDEVIY